MDRDRRSRRIFRDFFHALRQRAAMGRGSERADRCREALKLAWGSVTAAFLLVLVVCMGIYFHTVARIQDGQGSLRELTPLRICNLLEGGSALWQYAAADDLYPHSEDEKAWPGDNTWTEVSFDASSWKTGTGSFGSAGGTLTQQVRGRSVQNLLPLKRAEGKAVPVYYFRTEFQAEDAAGLRQLTGRILCDDCAAIYLNGRVIYAVNTPSHGFGPEGYGAGRAYGAPLEEEFVVSDLSALREGTNVLAVELHQASENSSDIYFELDYLKASNEPAEGFGAFREKPSDAGEQTGDNVLADAALDITGLVLEAAKTPDRMWANWLTDQKSAFAILWREKGGTAYGQWQSALMGRNSAGGSGRYVCNGEMSGLLPGREYEYKIADLASGRESRGLTFCTAGEEVFSFAFAGDPQIGAKNAVADGAAWEKALERALEIDPEIDFVVTAGDQADSSDPERAMEEFAAFRAPSLLKSLPLAVNMGNHESEENGMDDQFERLYENDLHDYWFVRGDALFYAINTDNGEYDRHIKALENTIREQKPRWIIVTMHCSIFGGRERSADSPVSKAREAYAQAFSDLNVDLALSGHDHLYARTFYMEGMQSTQKDGGEKSAGETLYLSGGSATGSKFYEGRDEDCPYLAFSQEPGEPVVTFISIDSSRIVLKACRVSDGEAVDQCEIVKKQGR